MQGRNWSNRKAQCSLTSLTVKPPAPCSCYYCCSTLGFLVGEGLVCGVSVETGVRPEMSLKKGLCENVASDDRLWASASSVK